MTRGVRLYLVGSFVLVSLAGCGRGLFQSAEREPWRAEGRNRVPEIRCRQGERRTGPDRSDFRPRNVRRRIPAEGRSSGRKQRHVWFCRYRFAAARHHRQSAALADLARRLSLRRRYRPIPTPPCASPGYGAPSSGPISLTAPGVAPDQGEIGLPPEGTPGSYQGPYQAPSQGQYQGTIYRCAGLSAARPAAPRLIRRVPMRRPACRRPTACRPLGPALGNPVASVGPVAG